VLHRPVIVMHSMQSHRMDATVHASIARKPDLIENKKRNAIADILRGLTGRRSPD